MGHIPLWAMGALVIGVLFDLPAFNIFVAVLGAGVLSMLMGA